MQVDISAARNGMSVSLKQTHEVMEGIKMKNVDKAIAYLQKVLKKEDFIPFKKYPSKGHQHGVPAGFPQKSTRIVIELLNELKANAKQVGADSNVIVSGYNLGKGAYPRYRGGGISHRGKRTNLRIFGSAEKAEKTEAPKEEKKPAGTETKPTENTAEKPEKKEETPKKEEKPATGEKKDAA